MSESQQFLLNFAALVFAMWVGAALAFTFGHPLKNRKGEHEKQQSTNNESRHTAKHQTNRAIVDTPNVGPESNSHENDAEQHRLPWRNLNVAVGLNMITLLAAVAGLFGLYILYGTLETTRLQANTSQREFELSERPWVYVTNLKVTQPLQFVGNVAAPMLATMGIGADLKNHGQSIALDVRCQMALVAEDINLKEQEKRTCEPLSTVANGGESSAIFPDESVPIGKGDMMRASEIQKSMAIWKKLNSKATELIPLMIICVDYQFSFSKEHHFSRYSYRIGIPVQGNGALQAITPSGVIKQAVPVLSDVTANWHTSQQ
jgi:hypothetical protein